MDDADNVCRSIIDDGEYSNKDVLPISEFTFWIGSAT
jgi:hypothetical protein